MGHTCFLLVTISLLCLGESYAERCLGKQYIDYSDWRLKPYCHETCKKIGIKGTNDYPSEAYGVYRREGNANYRTVYSKPGGWKMTYGCQENAKGGDTDAWFVTNTGSSSGAVFYSPYKTTCPSDNTNWWYKEKSSDTDWTPAGFRAKYVQVVCNPTNEAEFSPITKAKYGSTNGAMATGQHAFAWALAVALALAVHK
eukprot:GFUD01021004.1.p1 GENE.GFUD01021004.1~~GFUD01021004.1.p1  ORF type:complete len:198 (-),score=33.03 GFUD01021004.1:355-948(-)